MRNSHPEDWSTSLSRIDPSLPIDLLTSLTFTWIGIVMLYPYNICAPSLSVPD